MGTKEDELKKIQHEIDIRKKEFIEMSKPELNSIKDSISIQYQEFYKESLNHIRNISIASGTIAPFSLVLLQMSSLELYKELLILGFALLLVNIIYMQYVIFKDLHTKDKNIAKATLYHFFADTDLMNMNNEDSSKSVNAMFDYVKHKDTALSHLKTNKDYFEKETILTNSSLRKHLRISFYILAFGILFIVVSVVGPLFFEYGTATLNSIAKLLR